MEGIRKAREAAGLNQSELARKIGVTPAAVNNMERPGKYPDPARLPAIADALDVDVDALFERERKEQRTPVDVSSVAPEGSRIHAG